MNHEKSESFVINSFDILKRNKFFHCNRDIPKIPYSAKTHRDFLTLLNQKIAKLFNL